MAITIVILTKYVQPDTSPSMLHVNIKISNTVAPFGPYKLGVGDVPASTGDLQTYLDARADELWAAAVLNSGVLLPPDVVTSNVIINETGIIIDAGDQREGFITFENIHGVDPIAKIIAGYQPASSSGIVIESWASGATETNEIALISHGANNAKIASLLIDEKGKVDIDLRESSEDAGIYQKIQVQTQINSASILHTLFRLIAYSKQTVAAGFGTSFLWDLENAAGTLINAARLAGLWKTPTNGAEVGKLKFDIGVAGTLVEKMSIDDLFIYQEIAPALKQLASLPTVPSGYLALRPDTVDGALYTKDDNQVERSVVQAKQQKGSVSIVDSTTETTLFGGSNFIDANSMGVNGFIDVAIPHIYVNNTGAAQDVTYKIYWGSETLTYVATAIPASADRRGAMLHIRLCNAAGTGAQRMDTEIYMNAAAAVGNPVARAGQFDANIQTTHAQDTTSAKRFEVTAKFTNAGPGGGAHVLRTNGGLSFGALNLP